MLYMQLTQASLAANVIEVRDMMLPRTHVADCKLPMCLLNGDLDLAHTL